jgi:hypothetical protein
VCISSAYGYAHESNEAFFNIVQKQNTIEIQAEFPWTMRGALIAFNPELKAASNKEAFEKTFVEYMKFNLIFTNELGERLDYSGYREMDNNGHSHQNNYLLIFNGNRFSQVTNTTMFNIYDNQVNYHTLIKNDEEYTFVTNQGQPSFELPKHDSMNYWWVFMLIFPVYFLISRFLIKSKNE